MKNEVLHEKKEFRNMRELVEWAGEKYGDKIAYSYAPDPKKSDVVKISFKQFRDDVRALSTELLSMGCAGKHCMLIGKFSYELALVYFAVQSIGAVLVPLDREWSENELLDVAIKADVKFLFAEKEQLKKASFIAQNASLDSEPICLTAENEELNIAELINKGRIKFNSSKEAYFNAPIDSYKLSLLVFTSGTTGKGKGVMLSQNAILSDMSDVIPYIDFAQKTVGVLPVHHTYGSSVMLAAHVMIGCEVYITAGLRFVQKEFKEQKPGHLVLVPLYLESFYRKILAGVKEQGKEKTLRKMIKISNALRKVGIDLRGQLFKSVRAVFGGNLKLIITGGAPINPEILGFFESVGISTLNGYGITECAPIIAVNRSRRNIPGSVGPVIDMDTVKIVEPNEDGEGEIYVKGPNVMLGYYKDDEATRDAIDSEGFFKTGDYGKLDKNNVLYITGRKKNLIILSNGKNVYPEEIENELVATPGLLDIVVYEGQSKRGMEYNAIVAEIYPDKEFLKKNNIEDAKAYFKKFVSEFNKDAVPYKKITVVKIRDEEFPKNTLKKIMRFKIDMSID